MHNSGADNLLHFKKKKKKPTQNILRIYSHTTVRAKDLTPSDNSASLWLQDPHHFAQIQCQNAKDGVGFRLCKMVSRHNDKCSCSLINLNCVMWRMRENFMVFSGHKLHCVFVVCRVPPPPFLIFSFPKCEMSPCELWYKTTRMLLTVSREQALIVVVHLKWKLT